MPTEYQFPPRARISDPKDDALDFSRFVARLAAKGDADAKAMVARWRAEQEERP